MGQIQPKIEKLHARQILDSRGNPTIEVEIDLGNCHGRAAVPSGASTGQFEALELRDEDTKRFHGKGVLKAVDNVINSFGPALIGKDASNQKEIDDLLINIDGSCILILLSSCLLILMAAAYWLRPHCGPLPLAVRLFSPMRRSWDRFCKPIHGRSVQIGADRCG